MQDFQEASNSVRASAKGARDAFAGVVSDVQEMARTLRENRQTRPALVFVFFEQSFSGMTLIGAVEGIFADTDDAPERFIFAKLDYDQAFSAGTPVIVTSSFEQGKALRCAPPMIVIESGALCHQQR